MDKEEEEWIKAAYIEWERRRCVAKILSIKNENSIPDGSNYISEVSRLKISGVTFSGEIVEKAAIYKTIPDSEYKMKNVKRSGLFTTEARMYMETLRLMEKMLKKNDPLEEVFWPTFYGFKGNYENCLLEDLTPYGYKMPDRSWGGLDVEHCALALKKLAKFHAMGAVLLEKGEIRQRDLLKRSFFYENRELAERITGEGLAGLAEAIRRAWPEQWHDYIDGIKGLSVKLLDDIYKSFDETEFSFKTLNHGDPWFSNMLFKYDQAGTPTSIRYIDFQLVFVHSPCFDVQYLLGSSLRTDFSRQRDELFRLYHSCLAEDLGAHGYGGRVPSYEELSQDLAKTARFGHGIALVLRPMMINPPISELMSMFKETDRNMKWVITHLCDGEEYLKSTRHYLKELRLSGYL